LGEVAFVETWGNQLNYCFQKAFLCVPVINTTF